MSFTVVIPARHASQRLPGKPLLDICGLPMIARVCEQALASGAERVVVATDHPGIARAVPAGAEAMQTAPRHPSGTDRIAEVVDRLQLPGEAVVVNVQGDEPLLPPALVDQVARLLTARPDADMATLCVPLERQEALNDPNVVKVVRNPEGRALWFSRAPLPWQRERGGGIDPRVHRRHLGIYAYRVDFLRRFVQWPPSPMERFEALEQLRALERGAIVLIEDACAPAPIGVDTPEDLDRVRAAFEARAR